MRLGRVRSLEEREWELSENPAVLTGGTLHPSGSIGICVYHKVKTWTLKLSISFGRNPDCWNLIDFYPFPSYSYDIIQRE